MLTFDSGTVMGSSSGVVLVGGSTPRPRGGDPGRPPPIMAASPPAAAVGVGAPGGDDTKPGLGAREGGGRGPGAVAGEVALVAVVVLLLASSPCRLGFTSRGSSSSSSEAPGYGSVRPGGC